MKNKENFKYDKNKKPNLPFCLEKAIEKLKKRLHIVMCVNDLQTYHEWISLFPGLETKCDVQFTHDLDYNGYKTLARNFIDRTKTEEGMAEDDRQNLVKAIVFAKDHTKKKIIENFYSQTAFRNYVNESYMNGEGIEFIYPNDKKANFFMFDDGNFKVNDPLLKQVNYNLRAELDLVKKGRFVMYLEVFRFLFDFLSLNLSVRKNYYLTFI
jgi:hypothetical protein